MPTFWISHRDPLPFEDRSFDAIVSLQTIEHVEDVDRLFSEVSRLLAPGGRALHYFPSAETMVDPHSGVPFVHKFPLMRRKLLSFFSCLGIGKYRKYAREHGYSRGEFVDEFDEYLSAMCHYRKLPEYLSLSKKKRPGSMVESSPSLAFFGWSNEISVFFHQYLFVSTQTAGIGRRTSPRIDFLKAMVVFVFNLFHMSSHGRFKNHRRTFA